LDVTRKSSYSSIQDVTRKAKESGCFDELFLGRTVSTPAKGLDRKKRQVLEGQRKELDSY